MRLYVFKKNPMIVSILHKADIFSCIFRNILHPLLYYDHYPKKSLQLHVITWYFCLQLSLCIVEHSSFFHYTEIKSPAYVDFTWIPALHHFGSSDISENLLFICNILYAHTHIIEIQTMRPIVGILGVIQI